MSLSKYLARYSEPFDDVDFSLFPSVDNVIIIPAYNEPLAFIQSVQSFLNDQANVLAIIVLNQPDNDEDDCQDNIAIAQVLNGLPRYTSAVDRLYGVGSSYIFCLDRYSSQRIPRKQGVGLARKLGCDIAVNLYGLNKLASPWLHCTDADVSLPKDYFRATAALPHRYAVALYPFKHYSDDNQASVRLYEQRLHWYVAGLQWAQSPYAFHTIGSTLALNVQSYCKVRGFPKLAAGEDFHLLNKLAKTGEIYSLAKPVLLLDGRESLRVPFGTGRVVAQLNTRNNLSEALLFEAPETFVGLKTVLALYPKFWTHASVEKALNESGLDASLTAALRHVSFDKILTHAYRQSSDFEQFQKQLNTGFDALQSRRFIHYLAEHCYSNMSVTGLVGHQRTLEIMPTLHVL